MATCAAKRGTMPVRSANTSIDCVSLASAEDIASLVVVASSTAVLSIGSSSAADASVDRLWTMLRSRILRLHECAVDSSLVASFPSARVQGCTSTRARAIHVRAADRPPIRPANPRLLSGSPSP
eukprot:scaffold662_cov364-Pavlova_lutheri.AAC.33